MTPHRRLRGDEGMALVLVAVCAIILLMLAALALDGGQAFQQRRETQNAADAAAMAGARVLDKVKYDKKTTFTTASIGIAIRDQIVRNDGDATGATCHLIDPSRVAIGGNICDPGVVPTKAEVEEAFGVRVTPKLTRRTFFAGTFGADQTVARASASVLIQAWVPTGVIGSPFIVCGYNNLNPANPGNEAYDILAPSGTNRYVVKDSAIDKYYVLQASQVPDCNAQGSAFDGKGNGHQAYTGMPMWADIVTGTGFEADIQVWVAGVKPCDNSGNYDGCGMVLPLADSSRPDTSGQAIQLRIVKWSVWMVWSDGASTIPMTSGPAGSSCKSPFKINGGGMKYCGRLLGAGQGVVTGQGGGQIPTGEDLRVFSLAE